MSLPPPSQDDEWAYEIKWDGYRTLAFVDDGARAAAEQQQHSTSPRKYPELGGFAAAVNAPSAILDGELVVLDDDGRPSFELMQRHESQAAFYVFDVLQIDGADTIALPYEQRRALLEQLVEAGQQLAGAGAPGRRRCRHCSRPPPNRAWKA